METTKTLATVKLLLTTRHGRTDRQTRKRNRDGHGHGHRNRATRNVPGFLKQYEVPVYALFYICILYNRQCHHSDDYHMQQGHANCSQYVHP